MYIITTIQNLYKDVCIFVLLKDIIDRYNYKSSTLDCNTKIYHYSLSKFEREYFINTMYS